MNGKVSSVKRQGYAACPTRHSSVVTRGSAALGSICMIAVMMIGAPAFGSVLHDLTFSVDPLSLGWTQNNSNPSTWLNTDAGEWQVDAAADQNGVYFGPAGIVDVLLGGGIHSGEATIETFGPTLAPGAAAGNNAVVVFALTSRITDPAELFMFVASGQIRLVGGRQVSGPRSINNVAISVGNQQPQATHVYGWELDDTGAAPIFKVSFDGAQVGDLDGYDITAPFYATGAVGDDFYIGDATKPPAHAENWDRWTLRIVPEPATMGLLAVGAAMMMWRRRRV